jgi:hypothetical protein
MINMSNVVTNSSPVPPLPSVKATILANERLRLLAWGYYISSGIGFVFSLFLLGYALIFRATPFF